MNIILWIIVGLIAGTIAKMIMKEGGGWLSSILLGIGGGVVGGFLADLVGLGKGGNGFIMTTIIAVIGACLLLWIFRMLTKNRA